MTNLKDIRWRQRFENFTKSFATLTKYIGVETPSELERAGLIQLFEVTFELSWKVLKDYLESEGYAPISPRESIKEAFRIGIIQDGELWLDALQSRNLSSHIYDESTVLQILELIQTRYYPILQAFYETMHTKAIEQG